MKKCKHLINKINRINGTDEWKTIITYLSCLLSKETLTEPRTILRYNLNIHRQTQLNNSKGLFTPRDGNLTKFSSQFITCSELV